MLAAEGKACWIDDSSSRMSNLADLFEKDASPPANSALLRLIVANA